MVHCFCTFVMNTVPYFDSFFFKLKNLNLWKINLSYAAHPILIFLLKGSIFAMILKGNYVLKYHNFQNIFLSVFCNISWKCPPPPKNLIKSNERRNIFTLQQRHRHWASLKRKKKHQQIKKKTYCCVIWRFEWTENWESHKKCSFW